MKSTRLLTLALMLPFTWVQAAPADRFADVEIEAKQVSGPIYMLQTPGAGNIGVSVGADGTMIVDDQFAPLADKIIAALEGLGGNRPKLILNTHFHGDHAGANPQLGTTGTIIAHNNVRVRLLKEDNFARSGLPLVTFEQNLNIHFNDDEIELIHLPSGHTDGDSVVWFKTSNVIHMGDHFFKMRFPYIDVGSGGSVDGFIANVEAVLAKIPDDIKVIPGHGTLATKAELATTIAAIKATSTMVREQLAQGKSPESIAQELDTHYASWGSGFINASRWVQIIQAGSK